MRHVILVAAVVAGAVASGVLQAQPPQSPVVQKSDADHLWDSLSADKQRLLIKHAPKYVQASDGKLYLIQVEEEQQSVSRKPAQGRTERERAILDEGAPALYDPAQRKSFASRDEQYSKHCESIRADWEAKVAAIKKAELDKVKGDYITALEIVQVIPGGLIAKLQRADTGWEARAVRLDGYPLDKVVVDGDVLKADMKVRSVGRYQYTSAIGAVRTIERFEVVRVFEWEPLIPKLQLPDRSFASVKPAELALAATLNEWPGLPEWRIKKVKTSDGRDGGEVIGQSDNGWSTTRYVARRDPAVLQTYEWRWEVRYVPLHDPPR